MYNKIIKKEFIKMEDICVVDHIKELCVQRGWTLYYLAKNADMSYSALNTMIKKNHIPTINSLIKICNGFDITVTQFFQGMEPVTDEQAEILHLWNCLDDIAKIKAKSYMYGLSRQLPPLSDTPQQKQQGATTN